MSASTMSPVANSKKHVTPDVARCLLLIGAEGLAAGLFESWGN